MPFAVGNLVHVRGIGTGIVRAVRSGGRVTVEIKGRGIVVDDGLLERADAGKGRRGRGPAGAEDGSGAGAGPEGPGYSESLDLHGYTVEDAIVALDAFVNEALLASATKVRIIHGRSGGRIKNAVHTRLRELPPVRSFRLDPRNPGVTIVTL